MSSCLTVSSPQRSLASSPSDYGTCGSSSDEETCPLAPGICPHCKNPFQQPVSLQCGHSLCANCVVDLLSNLSMPSSYRRCRIRMGVRSYGLQRSSSPYRSPGCLVCHQPPTYFPPVPNQGLQELLRFLNYSVDHPAFRDALKFTSDSPEKEDYFQQCKVAILGARGVGKTSLKRVQVLNDIVFEDILGMGKKSEPLTIKMTDSPNDIESADGFILVYSITDRKSFHSTADYFSIIKNRRVGVPVVLVASKTDLWSERSVTAYEGQSLARSLNCPFLEVSAKKNDSVNEAFKELVRLVEIQKLQQTVV